MTTRGVAGRVHGLWIVLVVLAGVLSNLATVVDGGCRDSAPRNVDFSGDGQSGAATAPLGSALAVVVTCGIASLDPGEDGVPVQWTVLTGGGLVDGRPTATKFTWYDGRAAVNWQLGPDLGEQTVSARVRDRLFTFRATAGAATADGTCGGGEGTDFDPLRERRIEGTETWRLAGSPYRGGVVRIADGGTLDIEPGVTTCLQRLSVEGNGQLRAEGSATAPIEMAPAAGVEFWVAELTRHFGSAVNPQRHSTMRHVNARGLTALDVNEAALQVEDSRFVVVSGQISCSGVRWRLPTGLPAADSAVRRSVFEGYGSSAGCFGNPPAVAIDAPAALASAPMPFQARVIGAPTDGLYLSGNATAAVALSNCEVSGSGRDGVVIDHTGNGAAAAVTGCNLTGNAGFALRNAQPLSTAIDARGNWWGDPLGAPATGANAVSTGVNAGSPAAQPFALGY